MLNQICILAPFTRGGRLAVKVAPFWCLLHLAQSIPLISGQLLHQRKGDPMKRCPTCNRTADDNQRFCVIDGTPLIDDAPMPRAAVPGDEPIQRIQCQWCQAMNEKTALNCRSCAAPLDIKDLVSESGWREAR